MIFKEEKMMEATQLLNLYDSVGWQAYTNQPEKLLQAVQNSLRVITVWEDDQLLGLIRSVGDGETILYIQDLLVLPAYQNQGLGGQLMEKMLAAYPDVRQKVLLTEDTPATRHFYEKWGFASMDQGIGVAFFKEY